MLGRLGGRSSRSLQGRQGLRLSSEASRIPRIGFGWDSHEFRPGLPLKIGGVTVPHHSGLAGHSDGDVLLHALTDALLGSIAAGDIGTYFPPSDSKWKGADSVLFVKEALRLVDEAGYRVGNVDTTLILSEPKIGPHATEIQKRVAELLGIEPSCVVSKPRLGRHGHRPRRHRPRRGSAGRDQLAVIRPIARRILLWRRSFVPMIDVGPKPSSSLRNCHHEEGFSPTRDLLFVAGVIPSPRRAGLRLARDDNFV